MLLAMQNALGRNYPLGVGSSSGRPLSNGLSDGSPDVALKRWAEVIRTQFATDNLHLTSAPSGSGAARVVEAVQQLGGALSSITSSISALAADVAALRSQMDTIRGQLSTLPIAEQTPTPPIVEHTPTAAPAPAAVPTRRSPRRAAAPAAAPAAVAPAAAPAAAFGSLLPPVDASQPTESLSSTLAALALCACSVISQCIPSSLCHMLLCHIPMLPIASELKLP